LVLVDNNVLILPAVILSRFLGDIRFDTVKSPSSGRDRFT
jgi:hypothetical protein